MLMVPLACGLQQPPGERTSRLASQMRTLGLRMRTNGSMCPMTAGLPSSANRNSFRRRCHLRRHTCLRAAAGNHHNTRQNYPDVPGGLRYGLLCGCWAEREWPTLSSARASMPPALQKVSERQVTGFSMRLCLTRCSSPSVTRKRRTGSLTTFGLMAPAGVAEQSGKISRQCASAFVLGPQPRQMWNAACRRCCALPLSRIRLGDFWESRVRLTEALARKRGETS